GMMAAEHAELDLGDRVRGRALKRAELRRLEAQFRRQGRHLYVVGGYLRDLLLDLPVDAESVNLATDAPPDQTLEMVRRLGWPAYDVGKRFGTIGARPGEGTIEITTFRTDVYRGDDRHPEVAFGESILEDLVRRDLTINSMAVSLS